MKFYINFYEYIKIYENLVLEAEIELISEVLDF